MPHAVVASSRLFCKERLFQKYVWVNFVEWRGNLHGSGYALSVTENLVEVFGAQYVSKSCLGEESCRVMCIFHISHWNCGIWDPVVDHSIHGHSDRVFGQHLKQRVIL